jgi:hypothetical protein
MNIELGTVTISLARNAGEMEVNLATIPSEMIAELVRHGLQQKVADSCADKNKYETTQQIVDRSDEVVQLLKNGVWGQRKSGGRTSDPFKKWIESEALAMARLVKHQEKFAGKKLPEIAEIVKNSTTWMERKEKEWVLVQEKAREAMEGLDFDC